MIKIYSVYDATAKIWAPTPFFAPTDTHAVRTFTAEVNRADEMNPLYKYPEAFSLHRIGEYNAEEGTVKHTDREKLVEAQVLIKETK